MKVQLPPLTFRKGADVHGVLRVDTHPRQGSRIGNGRHDQSSGVFEGPLVEQVIYGWRQQQAVLAIEPLFVSAVRNSSGFGLSLQ
jgi:hypothetical protein